MSMTLKIEQTIKNLPKNHWNISKSMREAGYAPSTCVSGEQYNRIRKHTREYFNEDTIKRDLKKAQRLTLKENDLTNLHRNIELQARIAGLIINKQEVENKNPEKIIITYDVKSANTKEAGEADPLVRENTHLPSPTPTSILTSVRNLSDEKLVLSLGGSSEKLQPSLSLDTLRENKDEVPTSEIPSVKSNLNSVSGSPSENK